MTSSDGDRARPSGSPSRWGLRHWRVRSRLVALIAVPTVVAVALGALGVGTALTGAASYGRVGTLADVAAALTSSVGDLEAEQAESAAFIGAGRTPDRARAVADAQRRTDLGTGRVRALAAAIDDRYPGSTRDRLRRALFRLDTLPALRSAVTNGRLPAGVTVDRYGTVVTDLLALDDEIAQEGTDPELSASVRALGALSRSRAALATQRALLESALLAGRVEPGGDQALTQAIADQAGALQQFRTAASVAQTQDYDDVVAGADVDQTSAIRDGVTADQPLTGGAAAAGSWEASASGVLAKVGVVESGLVRAVADRADQLRSARLGQALIIGIIALAVVLVVLLATTAVARSLVRPLRALRDGALSVAERRLPDTVARLDREDPDTVDTRVEPIAVYSGDEIGEVARSFDAVHREAVRAAAGEARRRAQAGALFVTLSRRTQSLVDRQIELIDDLERDEEDADRLDSLFRLDHLATRMRRNGENLLVLGGQDPVRRWNRRLGLLEVVRAALSEIEQYPRVDVGEVPDATLAESAVSDVVHLLAELLDNATAFSSRASRVDVTATSLPDGSALVEITDRGIGLTAQECAELGERLAAPTEVGVDASRRMGLYVVGRLAARLGARVWLTPGSPRGVTASVTLPAAVLTEAETVPSATPDRNGSGGSGGSDGAWIGERFSRAIATPGPGPDSWFGGAPLATTGPAPGSPAAGAEEAASPGAAAFVPTASGTTDAGLPLRRPGANEVPGAGSPERSEDGDPPGSAARRTPRHALPDPTPAAAGAPEPPTESDAADRSPEAIRERYARYQRGRRQGTTGAEPPSAAVASGTGTTPGPDAPHAGAPDPLAPDAGLPVSAASDPPAPGTTAAGADAPPTGPPAPAAPDSAAPDSAAPDSAAPDSAAPDSAAPDSAAPGSDASRTPAAGTASRPSPTPRRADGAETGVRGPGTAGAVGGAGVAAAAGAASAGSRGSGSQPAEAGTPQRTEADGTEARAVAGADRPAGAAAPDGTAAPAAPDGTAAAAVPDPTAPAGGDPSAGPAPSSPTRPPEPDAPGTGPDPAPDVPWGAGPVREPTAAGSTASGLPLRAPGANYVPGAVPDTDGGGDRDDDAPGGATADGGASGREPDGGRPAWDRSAEAIRRRFAAHQQGRRRGMERTGR